jgi:hypothetical protein
MYQAISWFFKSPAPVTTPDGVVREPFRNVWNDGQRFDLRIYVADSDVFSPAQANPNAGELGSLLWEQKNLIYNSNMDLNTGTRYGLGIGPDLVR